MGHPRKRRVYKLTERVCQQARPGRHADGFGLYLDVRPSGSRAFVHRIVVNGRRRDIGLGGFPVRNARRSPRGGSGESAPQTPGRRPAGPSPLEEGGAHCTRTPRDGHQGAAAVLARLSDGSRLEEEASGGMSFQRLAIPLSTRSRSRTSVTSLSLTGRGAASAGYLVRQRLDILLRRAVVLKYRSENPAHQLLDALSPVQREPVHRPSLPHPQVRSALEALRASSASEVVKDVLVFIVLTAARLSEATDAAWSEIDFGTSTWGIPGSRMKAGHEHHVPLSTQALELLHRVQDQGHPAFVFRVRPSGGKARPVSGESLAYWMHKLQLRDGDGRMAVVHGCRTSFRAWALEVAHAPSEAAEAALAHRGTGTVRAYLPRWPVVQRTHRSHARLG